MPEQMATKIPSPVQAPAPSENKTPSPSALISGQIIPDEIFGYFNVESYSDRTSEKLRGKLNNILAYVNEMFPEADTGTLLLKLRDIENKLSHPSMGVSRVDHLYKYVVLQKQIKSLQNQKKVYEK